MAADLLAGLAAPALFVVSGIGLQAVLPRPLERSFLARLGFAYLLGLAWCTLVVWATNGVGAWAVSRSTFLGSGAVAVAAGVAAVARRGGDLGGWRHVRRAREERGGWPLAIAAVVVFAVSAALVADALVHPVSDFDGRMVWGTLARYVEAEGDVLPEVVTDSETYVIHPRYPLVLPLAQVAAAQLPGQAIESRAIRPLYALVLPALFLVLHPTLRRSGGQTGGAIAGLLLLAAPCLLWNREIGPRGTYSDFPLAAFLAGAAALLLHSRAARDGWRGAAAGLLLAAAAGSKNEGLVLAPIVAVSTLLTGGRGRRRAAGTAAAIAMFSVLAVVGWRIQIPNRYDEGYFEELSVPALVAGFAERVPGALATAAQMTLSPAQWGFAFWLLPLLVLAGRRGLRRRATRCALVWLAAQVGLVVAAYALEGTADIVAATWNRFLVQMVAPLAIVFAATTHAALVTARRRR